MSMWRHQARREEFARANPPCPLVTAPCGIHANLRCASGRNIRSCSNASHDLELVGSCAYRDSMHMPCIFDAMQCTQDPHLASGGIFAQGLRHTVQKQEQEQCLTSNIASRVLERRK